MLTGETRGQASSADAPPQAQAGTDDEGLFRGLSLTLGPIRWRANLTSEFRLQQPPEGPVARQFTELGTLNAASYIFQPWFAQLSANLGFVRGSSGGGAADENKSFSLTGGGSLSLFPMSRFPFSAAYSVSDSRASGENTGADYRNTQLSLRQSYRTADQIQYSASFERSELSGATIARDVLSVFGASVSARPGAHAFEVIGHWSGNTGGADGTRSSVARLNGRHGYFPASNLNVETLASYQRQEMEQSTVSLRRSLSNRFVQLATFASWRPQEDEPLYDEKHPLHLVGGLRLSAIGSEQDTNSTENLSVNGSLGLTYAINPFTQLSANASLTQSRVGGAASSLSSSQSVSVTYSPLPIPLREYTYGWNLSGGGSNATGGGLGRQVLFTQASHQVSRNIALAERSQITFSVSQGAGVSLVSGGSGLASGPRGAGGNGLSLTHNAQATWSHIGETATQTYVSASASDARNFGDTRAEFQLLNVQATRQAPLSALSFWTANLTVQGSRQRADPTAGVANPVSGDGFRFTTFGSVSYQHRRAFGVPRLRLFASYIANQSPLISRAQGDIDAPRQSVSDALEARLEYQIGKVDARLTFRSAVVEGRRDSVLFLRVTRQF